MQRVEDRTDVDLTTVSKVWWIPLAIGIGLILYAFIILSFTITTVWAVAIGLGIGLILAGIGQIVCATMVSSWRWVLGILGVVDIGLGVVTFVWPEATFVVLARLVGWVLLFRGVSDIVRAFEERRVGLSDWWILGLLGAFDIAVAFWAIRYVGHSIVILVLWIGIALLIRGIAAIALGFTLRSLRP